MSYISSDNIQIFPATRRTVNSASGRQLTEANLISLVGKLLDKSGFVITKDISSWNSDTEDLFEFVIHGYYVAVKYKDLYALFENNSGKLYACIKISKSVTVSENQEESLSPWFYEIDGQDTGTQGSEEYRGVAFIISNSEPEGYDYSLLILKADKPSDQIVISIPSESLIKFDIESIDLPKVIDAGMLPSEESEQSENS